MIKMIKMIKMIFPRVLVTNLLVCCVGLYSFGSMADDQPPNFIFILADDLGWGDLPMYGHNKIKTPNLDQLAKEGSLFTQFYNASAVCSPSRTAYMTGRFPATLGIHTAIGSSAANQESGMGDFLDPSTLTVTSALKSAGYKTGHFGKWHLSNDDTAMSLPVPPDPGAYGIDEHRTEVSTGPHFVRETNPDPFFMAKSSGYIIDETIRFIETHQHEPFYVNAWLLTPHAILNPTAEQTAPYSNLGPNGDVQERGANQIYFATVTDIDTQVGRLLMRLEELGLADNTVVVFASDNGPEIIDKINTSHSAAGRSGPFRGKKRSIYEGGVRAPFIVRWPNQVPAGRVDTSSVIAAVDVLPTVAELAGVILSPNLNLDGENIGDILLGNSRERTKSIFWEWRFRVEGRPIDMSPMLAIRDGKWKLLMNPDSTRMELYDMDIDPREMNNIVGKTDNEIPSVVQRLSESLLTWHATLPAGPTHPLAGSNKYRLEGPLGVTAQ